MPGRAAENGNCRSTDRLRGIISGSAKLGNHRLRYSGSAMVLLERRLPGALPACLLDDSKLRPDGKTRPGTPASFPQPAPPATREPWSCFDTAWSRLLP